MKSTFLYLSFACFCSSLVAAGPIAESKAAPDIISVAGPLRGIEPLGFNVDFPGGSINKFVAALAQVDAIPFTIIFNVVNRDDSADFSKIELPAFSLRNVSLLSVVEILSTLLEQRGFKLKPVGGPNSFVCMVQKIPANEKPKSPQIQFFSYQLAPFLQSQSLDDIVDAIHTAWELDPSHAPDILHIKFHPGTSILLVSGPQEAINIVQKVLMEVKRPSEQKSAAKPIEVAPEKK